jgi:hypothetical protein
MARSLLLSILVRQSLALKERFRTRYPHAWLVWEAGLWNVPETSEQDVATTRRPNSELRDCLPSGEDALCFELTSPVTPVELRLGRASQNAMVVNDATVSREHLALQPRPDGGWEVLLLPNTTPVRLDGALLEPEQPVVLRSGAQLELGDVRLTYHDAAAFADRVEQLARRVASRAASAGVP